MITYTSSDPLIVLLMLFYSNYVMRNKTVSIVSALTCSFKPVDTLCLLYPLCIIIIYMPCWFLLLNCLFHRISNLIANSYRFETNLWLEYNQVFPQFLDCCLKLCHDIIYKPNMLNKLIQPVLVCTHAFQYSN